MIPQSQPKKPKNSSKANLVISAIFHGILLLALFYFAARSGMLGHQIQSITVTKEVKPKEKPPEKKPEPPKETPKVEPPKMAEAPKPAPPSTAPPVVAPPAAEAPAIEGFYGKEVVSENDPVQLYKGYIEYTLRSKWDRPDNMDDDKYLVEVAVNVDKAGNISETKWLKGSGDAKWDQTVKDVFKAVSNIGRPPPTNFPPDVVVRFDVQTEEMEPALNQ
jgi:hypothetical protein